MPLPRAVLSLCSPALLAALAAAQTGPWQDGEILCLNDAGELLRIDPDTGHGAVLLPGVSVPAGPGYMAFDSYRGGVLLSSGLYPAPFDYKLRLVDSNGAATTIGNYGSFVQSLAPRGDGIVYFQENYPATAIRYLDANNVAHDLIDASTGQPIVCEVAQLIYHPQTNSLYGANNYGTPQACGGFQTIHVRHIPLSADGTQALAVGACNSFPIASSSGPVGLTRMYGGALMVCSASGANQSGCILSLDPATLALGKWADPNVGYYSIQGGMFSRRINRTLLLDAGNNVLKSYQQGQTGAGTVFPVDVSVDDGTSGTSMKGHLQQLDLYGGACSGVFAKYGAGLAGTLNFTPQLGGSGCASTTTPFSLLVGDARGGSPGILALGTGAAAVPLFGGTLLVNPIAFTFGFVTTGAPGVGGAGTYLFPLNITDPAIVGVPFWSQAGILDPNAVQGISLTNGLKIVIG
ncbi:MAG: hypothetical protein EPO68_10405 [Planctomycetota bacterium]|nr:MAG: hypothetical protein EPO68_10405 [Planctomycetota bacterium]